MGAFGGQTGLAIKDHIYTAEKCNYYKIDSDLPVATWDDPFLMTKQV